MAQQSNFPYRKNNHVTRVQHGCYQVNNMVVTRLLQGCYKVVTRLLQGCNKVVTTLKQTWNWHGNNHVTGLLQPCYNPTLGLL